MSITNTVKTEKKNLSIVLKSDDVKVLDEVVQKLVKILHTGKIDVKGVIPLPTKKIKWTFLKAPHIDKDARTQLERRIHKRLISLKSVDGVFQTLSESGFATPPVVSIEMRGY